MKPSVHGRTTVAPFNIIRTLHEKDPCGRSQILTPAEAKAQYGRPKLNVFSFGSMFEGLASDARNRLPEQRSTAGLLRDLAASMNEEDGVPERNTDIPAIYTYLGQFIDHDITKTEILDPALASNIEAAFSAALSGREVTPLTSEQMTSVINKRVPSMNLDSVLSSAAPRDARGALEVGPVTEEGSPPRPNLPFNDPDPVGHDLPRNPPNSTDEEFDRRARIGDPRNDENLAVAQLHVAFLRAHRRLVHESGLSGPEADLELQRSYQAMVVQDFLPRVCDPAVVEMIVAEPGAFYRPSAKYPFMALEFSVAAYRLGHSMVRNIYNYNSNFPRATLDQLFTFTAFSGDNFGLPTLPMNWIVDWSRWLEKADGTVDNVARQVDTMLAGGLMNLPQHQGVIGGTDVNVLALRNLVRGYLFRLPTGQAVAKAITRKLPQIRPITSDDILAVAQAASPAQLEAVKAGGFEKRTPLWYYLLAEAAHVKASQGKSHFGPIASVIVADVLVQLVKLANDNFLTVPGWTSKIPQRDPKRMQMADLLRFANVFPA